MFKLLRYSQVLAAVVLVAAVFSLSLLYRGLVFDSLVEVETRSNVALTQAFANAIWPAHAQFVAGAGAIPRHQLAGRDEIRRIDGELRQLSQGIGVVKVKIYDLRGLTVFSSDPRQIGEDKARNPGFMRARAGEPASELAYRDSFDAWEGMLSDRNIIASYVPVRPHDAAAVEAVLEVYSDVTPLVQRIERAQWNLLGGVLGAMALVYLALQLMLGRYQRLLKGQEEQRVAQEARIRHQAYHDSLTGLPNRASFTEHLDEALRRAKRTQWPLGLLFVDLDLFKRVNDSLGHDAGDLLLRGVAERIRRALRETDMLFRMGGDEFTVLLEDVRGPEETAMVAQRLIDTIAEPMQLQHHEIAVSASVGISMYPRDDVLAERLVKNADTAMYRAKELGCNRYVFFAREPADPGVGASDALAVGKVPARSPRALKSTPATH
jgi:diguanylate cyclase (GGDEF)-like protein